MTSSAHCTLIAYRHAILLYSMGFVVFAVRGYPSEALEAHVDVKALQAPVPEAYDGRTLASVAPCHVDH